MNMNVSKSLVITGSAAAIVLAVLGTGIARAASGTSTGTSIVDKIAERFNLNKSDVQQVFDQQKQDSQNAHAQQQVATLDQAVKDGKITQAQEDLIKAKLGEVKTFMDSLNGKTPAERQAAMKTEMDAIKQWVAANNIPSQLLRIGGPGMGGAGMGGRRMHSPTSSTTNTGPESVTTQ